MVQHLKKAYSYIDNKVSSFFMNLHSVDLPATIPEDYYVTRLIMKIEPILYDDSLTEAEKVNKLKHLIDRYDILEY